MPEGGVYAFVTDGIEAAREKDVAVMAQKAGVNPSLVPTTDAMHDGTISDRPCPTLGGPSTPKATTSTDIEGAARHLMFVAFSLDAHHTYYEGSVTFSSSPSRSETALVSPSQPP